MNFLAHIYLSFNDDEVSLGNFFADSIQGNKYTHLPERVQKGIKLHRHIDTFTDAHPTVRLSTKKLHQNYSHYSGIIVDIFYDHFLAKNWDQYSEVPLAEFVANFYELLEAHYTILPEATKHMMPYMIKENWIVNYAHLDGIERVLNGMNRRTKNKSKMNFAILDLKEHYHEFEKEFTSFFRELIDFSKQTYNSL